MHFKRLGIGCDYDDCLNCILSGAITNFTATVWAECSSKVKKNRANKVLFQCDPDLCYGEPWRTLLVHYLPNENLTYLL